MKKVIKAEDIELPENAMFTTPRKSIIDKEVFEATNESKRIIEQANREAQNIILKATQEKEAILKKAYDDGYQNGLKNVTELIAQAKLSIGQEIALVESEVIKLVIACAKKVVQKELEFYPESIVDIVHNALTAARQQHELFIRVNPKDIEILHENKSILMEALARAIDVDIREDPSIEPGGCIIDTEIGSIDARLSIQFEMLEKLLLNK